LSTAPIALAGRIVSDGAAARYRHGLEKISNFSRIEVGVRAPLWHSSPVIPSLSAAGTTYRFGEFEIEVAAYSLRCRGERIRLARQPMDLLLLLLERRQELVSRQDMAKRLWGPDVYVDVDAGIHTAIQRIRHVLGDSSESPRFVETVPGKGYRFIALVGLVSQSPPATSPAPSTGLNNLTETPRHNLPAELTSFVGRQRELLKLPGMLASSRLLSLTGAGGVGKTRLALRLASHLAHEYRDGVWLVDLSPLSVPDLVVQTIATAVGVREGPQRSVGDALLDNLRHRELLLVLDTCEHLVASCAEIVEALLRGAPALRIVATTREALGVSGETIWRVPSLSLPAASASVSVKALVESEATQLFIERASAVAPSFAPSSDNADAIVRICRRLDGIPLAIELAAARVVVLSPEQIEARLQDRFRLLTGGARTAVARQRTLEATVDWSYQLLPEDERQLLGRLSVFPAAWTLEAAEQVCGGNGINTHDVLDLLSRLVNRSLVVVERECAGERRYRFLETVRQYALERLARAGATDRLRERHFYFFFNEFRGVLPVLRGHGQVRCLQRLRTEQENVRAALEWALTSPALTQSAVELAGALFWFWTKRGLYEEGKLWLERALTVGADAAGPLRARALIGLAHMHTFQGRRAETAACAAQALALGHEAGDAWVVSRALFLQALAAFESGDRQQATVCSLAAREAADASGEPVEHGGPLMILANVAVLSGDHDHAQRLYDQSIEVHRLAGDAWGLSILLSTAAGLRIVRQDFDLACAQASEAMSLCQELEDPRGIAWSLDVFAGLLAAAGYQDEAARLWGASDGLLESVSGSLVPTIGWIRDRYLAPVKKSLGGGGFETARAEGRAMPLVQAIAFARQQALLLR
jgi:predicted ATPase/DNA-binding winged helix-turn-helix (wHTH) protein